MSLIVRCGGARAGAVGLALAVLMGVLPASPVAAQTDPPAVPRSVVLRLDVSVVGEKSGPVSAVEVSASYPAGSGVLDVPATVRVSVGAAGDSATGSADGTGADYVNVDDFEVVIPAGESSVTVENGFILRVVDDDLAEGFERLTVSGSTEASGISEVVGAEVVIVDDDGAVVLSVDADPSAEAESARVGEGDTASVRAAAALPVGKTAERDVTVRVEVGAEGDAATGSGVDYAEVGGFEVVIPTGENRASVDGFAFYAAEDDLAEGDETVSVTGKAGEGFAVAGAALTIVDDDGAISLSVDADPSPEVASARVTEGETAEVEAVASLATGITAEREVSVSVTVGAEGDTATGSADGTGADYAAVDTFEVIIPAGEGEGGGSFSLAVTDDEIAGEGDEQVTVSGEATGASGYTVSEAKITILNGDTPVGSGGGEGKETEQSSSAAEAVAQTPTLPAPTKVILTADTTSVAEGASSAPNITFTAAFPDGTATLGADVRVRVTVGKTGDSAVSSTDYAAINGFDMTIAMGSSSVTASKTLMVTNDNWAEGDEILTITGSVDGDTYTVDEETITITDAADSLITLSVDTDPGAAESVKSSEDGENPSLAPGKTTVVVSGSLPANITAADNLEINFTLGADGDTAKGSATGTGAGVDYKTISDSSKTIVSGARDFTGHDVILQATDDDVAWEGDESVTVKGVVSGVSGFTVAPAVVYISDSDDPDVTLTVSPSQVGEEDGSPQLTVTAALPDSLTAAVEATVSVSVSGGTAMGSADGMGADYTNLSSAVEVKIEAGESSGNKAFSLTITDDTDNEGAETVTLTGSGTVSVPNFDGTTLGSTNQSLSFVDAELTIVDNDDLITLTVDTSSDSGLQSNVGEADGSAMITVTVALHTGTASTGGLTVPVTVGKDGDSATGSEDGTNADYTKIDVFTLTIAENTNSASSNISLAITQDELAEGPETITFNVATPPMDFRVPDASVTIDDDDNNITLSVDPVNVLETSGNVPARVALALDAGKTAAAELEVTVSVGKDGDTATSSEDGDGADYAEVNDFAVRIHQGGSADFGRFTLAVTDDTDWEGNETQSLTVVGTLAGFTINESTITITDNDLNPAGCGDGSYVDNHATQTGLVADCRALINIRNHWVSTRLNYDWDTDHPVLEWGTAPTAKIGSWEGVTVEDTDPDPGTDVSRVTKLEMLDESVTRTDPDDPETAITEDRQRPGLEVNGILPASIGDLTALEYLYLNNNQLASSIPTEIGNLVKLKKLYLHGNLLFGSLPTQMGSLTPLTELFLNNNLLSGNIPTQLGSLTNLTKLWLDDNLLRGSIPTQLGSLTNLTELHLNENLLSGTIPTELGNLTNLKELFLSDNYSVAYNRILGRIVVASGLSGKIPKELKTLTNLEKLRLDDNYLSGNIPADLGQLAQLKEMWLEDNLLEGTIPSELGNLSNLEGLDLSINRLSGAVPSSLGNLANLEYLTLGNNRLTSLPPELGNLSNLESLDLFNNQLSTLPSEIGDLSNLEFLDLSNNQLSSIPSEIGDLGNLESLRLRHNEITSLPTELGKLVASQGGKLRLLYIQDLGPSAPIPERLLEVPWIDLFAFDDPLDLIAFRDFSKGLATTPREYEVWTCDVGGTLDITPEGAVTSLSRNTDFFREMSDNKFALTFRVGGAVTSTHTWANGGLAAARKSCLDQIRPNRDKQLGNSRYRDIDRKIIIVDNHSSNGGLNHFYTVLGIPPHVERGESGYQQLTVDNIIHVGGGTVFPTPHFPRLSTVAHEIGHGLQWPHSYGGRIVRGGEVYEYDNRMDLLSGRVAFDLTTSTIAVNRYASGWIAPEDVALHTGAVTNYVLSPLGEEGTQMLAIPTAWSPGTFYTLGVRVQEGIDRDVPLEGVELYFVDQRHYACNISFAGLCGNTRRRTIPINPPNLDYSKSVLDPRRYTIENVFDESDEAFTLNVGVLTEEGEQDRLRVAITRREGDKFTVQVGALPFQPVRTRSILGLPEDINVSATVAGSNTVREGGSRRVSVTASYPRNSRTSRIPARVSLQVSGSARDGSDFTGVNDFAMVIPAGGSTASGSFTLRTVNDSLPESAETIRIAFRAPGYDLSGDTALTFTIPTNDQPPPPSSSGGGGGGGGGGGFSAPSPPVNPPPPPPPVQPACAGRFCDEDGSVHQSSIETIAEWRITVGCDASDPRLFCPSQSITRRQMAAFLYRAVTHRWGTPPAPERQELGDVGAGAWYRLFADWAVANGVMEAAEGMFHPGGVVTRADMARMLVAAFPHLNPASEAEGRFSDVEGADEETVRAMEGLFQAGVTRGCATGPLRFCPNQPVTRAQMASFFVRALNQAPAPAP